MKRILLKSLTCVLIVMLVINFVFPSYQNYVFASTGGDLLSTVVGGLVGVILWIPKAVIMGIVLGIHALVTAFAYAGRRRNYRKY